MYVVLKLRKRILICRRHGRTWFISYALSLMQSLLEIMYTYEVCVDKVTKSYTTSILLLQQHFILIKWDEVLFFLFLRMEEVVCFCNNYKNKIKNLLIEKLNNIWNWMFYQIRSPTSILCPPTIQSWQAILPHFVTIIAAFIILRAFFYLDPMMKNFSICH